MFSLRRFGAWPTHQFNHLLARQVSCHYSHGSSGLSQVVLKQQIRGAKRQSSLKVGDLQQGSLTSAPLQDLPADDAPIYPAVVQGHFNNVKKFNGCVVLTKVGNFYELYGEQAEKYGPLLNLKVAKRKTALGPVAMSGFQFFQLDRYLKLLVQDLNTPVAISDEVRNSPSEQIQAGGLMYTRKVTRVITAGTLIDETFVDPYENNFLLGIHADHVLLTPRSAGASHRSRDGGTTAGDAQVLGLSWVDLSSGDFFTQATTVGALSSFVARISPREILLGTPLEAVDPDQIKQILGEGHYNLTHHVPSGQFASPQSWNEIVDRPLDLQTIEFGEAEVSAASLVLDYVQSKLQNLTIALRSPIRRTDDDTMIIDKYTLRGLEIKETLRDGFAKGSLLHTIKRTVTKSGSRALTQRILSPSMSISILNARFNIIEELLEHDALHEMLRALLEKTFDTPRLLIRFSVGRGDADDLLGIGQTISMIEQIFHRVRAHALAEVDSNRLVSVLADIEAVDMQKLSRLARRIQDSIDEEGLQRQHSAEQEDAEATEDFVEEVEKSESTGKRPRKPSSRHASRHDDDTEIWIMKKSASPTLAETHEELMCKFVEKKELLTHLRETLGLKSISLKWLPNTRHHCHVKGKDCRIQIPDTINLTSTKTTRTFILPAWSQLGKQMDEVKLRIRAEEQRVFARLRDEVLANLIKLRRCATILDDLDIACSSAQLARERDLVRPILHSGIAHHIVGGRHPMVDAGLEESGRSFTKNDCRLGGAGAGQIMLLTGPNMAGKSTYLRQNALISILTQSGCYVPAEYAEIGLVDRIFSRVGSADNLFNHQSTFMVEMVEVAEILKLATRRSFVIMDEVGRGTTPEDGVAVGYACLKHLHDRIDCRALFATHFHTLADMTQHMDRLTRWCTDVEEAADGSWSYNHRLKEGVNRSSHALKVARLAGMPDEAIATAREVLESLQGRTKIYEQRQADETEPVSVATAAASA